RNIGELFASQSGKLVAVSAGDSLETVMAAHGSGAIRRSIRDRKTVANVDIGGGTSKTAICGAGEIAELTAIDLGARLVCFDEDGRVTRMEEAGRRLAADLGIDLRVGEAPAEGELERLADHMADRLVDALHGVPTGQDRVDLHRLAPLSGKQELEVVTF